MRVCESLGLWAHCEAHKLYGWILRPCLPSSLPHRKRCWIVVFVTHTHFLSRSPSLSLDSHPPREMDVMEVVLCKWRKKKEGSGMWPSFAVPVSIAGNASTIAFSRRCDTVSVLHVRNVRRAKTFFFSFELTPCTFAAMVCWTCASEPRITFDVYASDSFL